MKERVLPGLTMKERVLPGLTTKERVLPGLYPMYLVFQGRCNSSGQSLVIIIWL